VKWIAFTVGGLVLLVAGIATVGLMLPRTHKATRTLRVKRPPADVWPVVMQVTQASDVPVDVLDSQPPHHLVTRVTEKEKNFGGTWTIDLTPAGDGSTVTIAEDGWVANPSSASSRASSSATTRRWTESSSRWRKLRAKS
jgi:hypothetical protein